MAEILLLEDEESVNRGIEFTLKKEGYEVENAGTIREACELFQKQEPKLMICDVNLPDGSSLDLIRRIRKTSLVHVICLTAMDTEIDQVMGYEAGADDYITKPFSLKNLSARVQAVLRRSTEDLVPLARQFSWNQGDLVIDYDRKEVRKKGEPVALTAIEWKLLAAFTKYPQKIFTREKLIELVFGLDFSGYDRVIDTHIKNLRKKIEDDSKQPVYLCTVHGMGYKFGGTAE